MVNVQFDDNLNSFQVKEPDLPQGFEIVKQEELELPFLYHAHKFEKSYISFLRKTLLVGYNGFLLKMSYSTSKRVN